MKTKSILKMACVSAIAVSVTVSCDQLGAITGTALGGVGGAFAGNAIADAVGVDSGVGKGLIVAGTSAVGAWAGHALGEYLDDYVATERSNYKTTAEYLKAQNANTEKAIADSKQVLAKLDSEAMSAEQKKDAIEKTIAKLEAASKDNKNAMAHAETASQKEQLNKVQQQINQTKKELKAVYSNVNKM